MIRRALFLTTSFPRHADDWAGRFVADFAADLTARGCGVRVLAPGAGWAPPGVQRLGWRAPGGLFDGHGAPEALRRRPLRASARAAAAQGALTVAARRHARPDELIVGHWLLPSGPAALAAARRVGAPVHLVAHGSDVALLERLPRLTAHLLDGARGITFVSEDLAARFEARLGRGMRARRHVIPMGIAPSRPCAATAARLRALAGGRRVIATIGRMVPVKGFDVLLAALDRLRTARGLSDVVWMAAGDGPQRGWLIERAAARGIAFEALGGVTPAERDALLAESAVCVVPSRPVGRRREGTPLVVLEALAAGAPLVASAVGGIPPAAGPAGAVLVAPGDPAALAAALRRVLDDAALSAAMTDRHRAAGAGFRWSAIGPRHAAAMGLVEG